MNARGECPERYKVGMIRQREPNNFRYIAVPYIRGTTERTNRTLKKYDQLGSMPSNTLQKILNNSK